MAIYTGTTIKDLDVTTPVEGASYPPELNDAVREIKTALKNNEATIAKTSAYTVLSSDKTITCTGSSNFTLTLPQQSAVSSATVTKEYTFINVGTGIITLAAYAGDTSIVTSLQPGQTIKLIGNGGTTWHEIISHGISGNTISLSGSVNGNSVWNDIYDFATATTPANYLYNGYVGITTASYCMSFQVYLKTFSAGGLTAILMKGVVLNGDLRINNSTMLQYQINNGVPGSAGAYVGRIMNGIYLL